LDELAVFVREFADLLLERWKNVVAGVARLRNLLHDGFGRAPQGFHLTKNEKFNQSRLLQEALL